MPLNRRRATRAVRWAVALLLMTGTGFIAAADEADDEELPSVAELTADLERRDGLLLTYLDARRGKLWLELPQPSDAVSGEVGRFLYVEGLTQGLGSNPVNLDRGQLGETAVVRFRRVGGKLLVEQVNTRFVAASEDAAERRAVEESFATSVLWAGEVAAEDPPKAAGRTGGRKGGQGGRFLVDFTPFVVRDAHRTVAQLQATGQGAFQLDAERSALDPAECHAFPDNLELEAVLTFAFAGGATPPGEQVRATAPAGDAITLRQHHSLIRLPGPGFEPRAYHPASGFFPGALVADYAVALDEPIERRSIARFRLHKADPLAERSPAVEPIVFYLDPGVPEPVRGALAEGARWWAEAFAAAGFEDAFQVRMLPPGAHPLDVRYNVIQWVHRSTRGWSYGGGVIDPRTGEIVKGHVNLGSLRVRQDRLIFEGLLGAGKTGTGAADDPVQLALARLRQLAAHEVGHALGLAHNFAASTFGRASVMDYPAPWVRIGGDGSLDVSQAYGVGIGAWDRQTVRYGYSAFPTEADEAAELAAILADSRARGFLHIGDQDARMPGVAHPRASLWDNGADPVEALQEALAVRRVALDRLGLDNLRPGTPVALLQETLVPIYLYHRYQLEAAAKLVGGFEYDYAVRGPAPDGGGDAAAESVRLTPVPAARQREALDAILSALDPQALDLPEDLLRLLLPRPLDYPDHPELFRGATGPGFDPLAAAGVAADLALRSVLQPQRAARLVDFQRRDPDQLGFEAVLHEVLSASFDDLTSQPPPEGGDGEVRHAEIRRTVQRVTVERLIDLATGASSSAVRSLSEATLRDLAAHLEEVDDGVSFAARAHVEALAAEIRRFLDRPAAAAVPQPAAPEPPPGSPIGAATRGGPSRAPLAAGCSLGS